MLSLIFGPLTLAWELIEIMLQPQILSPWLAEQGYLPTQTIIGEGPYADQLRKSIPFYDEMISMIPDGQGLVFQNIHK